VSATRDREVDVLLVRGPVALRLLHPTFVCLRDIGVCVARSEARVVDGDSVHKIWITDEFGFALQPLRWHQVLIDLVRRLALIAEQKDPATERHIARFARYAEVLARGLGVSSDRARMIRHASQLHDVGNAALLDAILLRPARSRTTKSSWCAGTR